MKITDLFHLFKWENLLSTYLVLNTFLPHCSYFVTGRSAKRNRVAGREFVHLSYCSVIVSVHKHERKVSTFPDNHLQSGLVEFPSVTFMIIKVASNSVQFSGTCLDLISLCIILIIKLS